MHVEVWVAEKRATGRATLNTNDLDLQVAKVRGRGATTVDASFGSWSWETRHASDARLAIRLDDASIATIDAPARTLVRVRSVSVDAHGNDIDVADPLRSFVAAIRMPSGQVIDEVFLRAYLPEGDEMHIEHGQARFDARCDVDVKDHRAAGTLEVRADRVGLAFRDLHLTGDVSAHGMVHDWDWPRGDLAVDAARVDLRNIGLAHASSAAAVTITHLGVAVSSPRFSFSDPLARARLAVAIEGGKVNDSTALDEFVPKGSTFTFVSDPGSFDVHFAADVTKHVAAGKLAVVARGMGIAGEKLLVAGDVGIDAAVERWDFDRQTIGVEAAEVTVDHVRGALDRTAQSADFTAERIALNVNAASFDLAHPSLRGVDYRLRVARADLQDARVFNALLPREKIFAVESGSAQVSADVALSPSRRAGEGQVHVTLRDAAVRFQASHFAGQFAVDVRVAGFDPEHSALDLAGSRLWMHDVRVTGASTSTSAWQGNVLLRAGTLRFDPAPAMNGVLSIDARDASPVLAILLGDSLPRFPRRAHRYAPPPGKRPARPRARAARPLLPRRAGRRHRGSRRVCGPRRPSSRCVRDRQGAVFGRAPCRRRRGAPPLLRSRRMASRRGRRRDARCSLPGARRRHWPDGGDASTFVLPGLPTVRRRSGKRPRSLDVSSP